MAGRSGACYELVWVNGVQLRMTFPQQGEEFPGAKPSDKVDNFYVVAPQTGTPQGTLPFLHDHVVRDVPSHNQGAYSVLVRGFFVLCSAQGIVSGACVPYMAVVEGLGTLPLAMTVNGAGADIGRAHRSSRKLRVHHAVRHRGNVPRRHQPRQVDNPSLPRLSAEGAGSGQAPGPGRPDLTLDRILGDT